LFARLLGVGPAVGPAQAQGVPAQTATPDDARAPRPGEETKEDDDTSHETALSPAGSRATLAVLVALRRAASDLALVEPERARSLLFRARAAPWLPELRIRVDRRFGRTESLDAGATALPLDSGAPVGLDTIDDVRYELRATWDLARLVFNPDEVQAASQALRMADVRRELENLVVKLFVERLRLLGPRRKGAPDLPRDLTPTKELRRLEVEAELDALTGGLFSRLTRDPMEVMVPSDERSPSR